jgi:hypothetical protein
LIPLIARERGGEVALEVDVGVVADVDDDLHDPAARERELRRVLGADRVPAVIADAQTLAAEGVGPAMVRISSFATIWSST